MCLSNIMTMDLSREKDYLSGDQRTGTGLGMKENNYGSDVNKAGV